MKFSFKKKDAGASGEAKSTKRKARSGGKSGMASMKSFFADHGEKLVFGIIVAVSAYIIYSGFSQDGLKSEPDDVRAAVTRAASVMDADTWAQVKAARHPEPDTFKQQATEDTIDISSDDFAMEMPWHPVLQAQRQRRQDPDLIAPLELEVRPGYGPLSVVERAGGSDLSNLINRGTSVNTRPLPDKYREKSSSSIGGQNIESRFFVSVTGLVPVRQQQEMFKNALANAIEYEPERDTPKYLAIDVQRRETRANKQGDWVNLNSIRVMRLEPKKWDGRADERADSGHVISTLVMPLPPLTFRDISKWALHSKIPEAVEDDFTGRDGAADTPDEPEEVGLWDTDGAVDDRPEDGVDDRVVDDSRDSALPDNQLTVEYGLLRYFDFQVQSGRTYEYRVRFFLEDPNNPRNYQRPSDNACVDDVIVRRQGDPKKRHVESPWSDVSPQVRVPTGRSVYAGPVVAPSLMKVNSRISLPRRATDEPEATVMAVTWDPKESMDVPSAVPVKRGSVVNQRMISVWAVDPAKRNIRRLDDYSFSTNALVVDIAGGEVLERRGREDIRAPGMVLLMDERGNLVFHNEVQDFEDFDYHSIPPDEEDDSVGFTDQPDDNDDSREDRGRDGRPSPNLRGGRDRQPPGEAGMTGELRGGRQRGGRGR